MKKYKFCETADKVDMYAMMPLFRGMPVSRHRLALAGAWQEPEEPDSEEELSWQDDRGVGVVELILILVVLIALVAIFKTQLTALVNTILAKITTNANSVMR